MNVATPLEIPGEAVDSDIPLLLLRTVAADAMRLQKPFKRFRAVRRTCQTKAGNEDQAGTPIISNAKHELAITLHSLELVTTSVQQF